MSPPPRIDSGVGRTVTDLVDIGLRTGDLAGLEPAEKKSLAGEVADAFERGDIDGGLAKLLAHATGPRGQRQLTTLVESALQALGVDLNAARGSWQKALTDAATQPASDAASLRNSPVRDAFQGLHIPLTHETAVLMRRAAIVQARFDASLAKALESPEKVKSLRALFAAIDPAQTTDTALMSLVSAFREAEAWEALIEVYEKSPKEFRELPIPSRDYALALSLTGRSDDARAVLQRIVRENDPDAATFGLLARLHKHRWDEAARTGEKGAEQSLQKSIQVYRQAYDLDRTEIYPGINLPVLLEAKGDAASIEESQRISKLILLAAKRRASGGDRDYWDAAGVIEMAASLRDYAEAEKWLGRAIACGSEPWMRKSTARNLERLAGVRKARGEDVAPILELVKRIGEAGTERIPGSTALIAGDDALAKLIQKSYRFEAHAPKWLSGNYQYDGIAHDVRATPADIVYFSRILSAAGIDKESDPLQASAKIDALIRKHYRTAAMEDMTSEEHQRFDEVMPGLARLMGAQRTRSEPAGGGASPSSGPSPAARSAYGSSQTNVSADWINGLGDCRQHAPTKLLLFGAWKQARAKKLLDGINQALADGEAGAAKKLEAELGKLNSWEMRILDANILDAETRGLVELHTLTLLLHKKAAPLGEEMTGLEEVRLADSFYQEKHKLADGVAEMSVSEGELALAVPAPSANGRPIVLVPAPYSFDRSAPSVDFGQLTFRGVQVASPGWERSVPVDGLDLTYVHEHVLA